MALQCFPWEVAPLLQLLTFYILARPCQMGAGWSTTFLRFDTPPVLISRWLLVLLRECPSCAWYCAKSWASTRMEKEGGIRGRGTNFKEVSRLCNSQVLNVIPYALPIRVSHVPYPFILTSRSYRSPIVRIRKLTEVNFPRSFFGIDIATFF